MELVQARMAWIVLLMVIIPVILCQSDYSNETCEAEAEKYYLCLKRNSVLDIEEEKESHLTDCFLEIGCKQNNTFQDYFSSDFKPSDDQEFPPWKQGASKSNILNDCRKKVDEMIIECMKNDTEINFPEVQRFKPFKKGKSEEEADCDKLPDCTDDQSNEIAFCLIHWQPYENFVQKHNMECKTTKQCISLMTPSCQNLLKVTKRKACRCTTRIQPQVRIQDCLNGQENHASPSSPDDFENADFGDKQQLSPDGFLGRDDLIGVPRFPGGHLRRGPPTPARDPCDMTEICHLIPEGFHPRPFF